MNAIWKCQQRVLRRCRVKKSVKPNVSVVAAAVVAVLALCSAAFAHHGSASYDDNHVTVLKDATVTKINWGNPHIILLFDAKNDQGEVEHWVAEANGASAVSSSGWTKTAIQPGDTITVYLYRARNGRTIGRVGKVILADGTVFGTGELIGDRPSVCDKDFTTGGNESTACRPDGRKTNNNE